MAALGPQRSACSSVHPCRNPRLPSPGTQLAARCPATLLRYQCVVIVHLVPPPPAATPSHPEPRLCERVRNKHHPRITLASPLREPETPAPTPSHLEPGLLLEQERYDFILYYLYPVPPPHPHTPTPSHLEPGLLLEQELHVLVHLYGVRQGAVRTGCQTSAGTWTWHRLHTQMTASFLVTNPFSPQPRQADRCRFSYVAALRLPFLPAPFPYIQSFAFPLSTRLSSSPCPTRLQAGPLGRLEVLGRNLKLGNPSPSFPLLPTPLACRLGPLAHSSWFSSASAASPSPSSPPRSVGD